MLGRRLYLKAKTENENWRLRLLRRQNMKTPIIRWLVIGAFFASTLVVVQPANAQTKHRSQGIGREVRTIRHERNRERKLHQIQRRETHKHHAVAAARTHHRIEKIHRRIEQKRHEIRHDKHHR
jgi:hypothetical protein